MSAKNTPDVKRNSGADLKAMAEAKFAARQAAMQQAAAAQQPKTPREQLDEYKVVVRRGMRGFVETGTALGLIAKQNLYREDGYGSFEAFVEAEFELAKTTAYRLIEAARVVAQLSQVGTIASTITNQAQALELAPLVKSVAAMARVVEAAQANGPITADLLKATRLSLFPNPKVIDGELASPAIEGPKAGDRVMPPCEKCGALLDEGSVTAAQTRCLTCDPEREHFALNAGGPCDTCGQDAAHTLAAQPKNSGDVGSSPTGVPGNTAADVRESASADGGSDEGRTSALEPPAGDGPVLSGPVPGNPPSPPDLDGVDRSQASDPSGLGSYSSLARDGAPFRDGAVQPPADGPVGEEPDLTPAAAGEAPSASPAAQSFTEGQTPHPPAGSVLSPASVPGVATGVGDEAAGEDSGQSSSADPASAFLAFVEGFAERLALVDADVVGPLLTDEQLGRLDRAADELGYIVGLLRRWAEKP